MIATEIHSSARIDRQLVGRAARQGDPGSYRFFVSLEDELLKMSVAGPTGETAGGGRGPWPRGIAGRVPEDFLSRAADTRAARRRNRKLLLKHEDQRFKSHRRIGLDPFLELIDDDST